MKMTESGRRGFLKSAGAGIAGVTGVAIGASISTSATQSSANPSQLFVDARAFGAVGDGRALDTPAINRAIEAAAASGGGTVYLRSGKYLCYSIHLKSNVAVLLDQAATIVVAGSGNDPVDRLA